MTLCLLCLQLTLPATGLETRLLNQQSLASVRIQTSITLVYVKSLLHLCLRTDDPPRITSHPKELKDVVGGTPASFTVHVTGSEPLSYQWQHKPRGGSEGWQAYEVERYPGADSSTLTIASVQMSNEGSYRCTVSNCAGSETSDSVTLTVGELKFMSLQM